MLKKLQKTFVILLALLISGLVPTISAIAAVELVDSSPEFQAAPDKTINVLPGGTVDFKIKLAYTGGNQKNTSGTIHVDTKYYIGYPENPAQPKETKDIPYSGETLSTIVEGAQIFVGANVPPGPYKVPIQIKIDDNKPGTGNTLVNETVDMLTVNVLGETVKPVVNITNPIEGKYYQSSQLPANPEFTVVDQSPYTTTITGWDKTTDGMHTVTVTATDKYKNVGQASVTYYIDNTPPEIATTLVNHGVYNADSLKDNVKNYYTITEMNPQSSSAPDLDLTAGAHTVKITATDKAGNYSEKVINYVIDNDAPTISFKFNDEGFYTSKTFKTFDPYYDVKDDNLDNSTINASTPVFTEGSHSVTVSASDKAKNHASATASYTIDDTAPKVTINLENGKYYNASALSAVGDFYSATDENISAVKPAGFGTTDGHYNASVRAVDMAGNATEKEVEYYVDTIDPVITIDSEKIANGGFYKSSYLNGLTNFYTVADANTDIDHVTPFDLTEGEHTLTITARDKAGNIKTETITYTVDNSAPTISFNLTTKGFYNSKNLPENYYSTTDNNEVVSVVASAYDKSEGTHELTVTAMDAAGNSTEATIKYTVDNTNPEVSISLPANGGFYKSSDLPDEPTFTVKETNNYTTNITGYNKDDDAEHTVTVKAADIAGNEGSTSVTYTVDNTEPVITTKIVNGGFYNKETIEKLGQYYEVSDINIDQKDISADELVLTEGKHSATITAIDKAGNKSVETIEYTVDNTVPTITFNFNDGGFYTTENFKKFDPYYEVKDENLDESTITANEVSFAERENQLTVSAADLAKNANSATAHYTIDDTNPEVTLHLAEGKFYNQSEIDSVHDFYTATDKNLFSVEPAGFGRTDGHYIASVKATDKAGNGTTKTVTYHVDTVKPVITIHDTKLANEGFYQASYLENLKDYYSVKDENIDRINVSPFKQENGTYTFTITATDKAGNTETESLSYTIDNTPPTINFSINKEYYQSANLPLEYYTADDNNKVVKVEADDYDQSEGTHTLKVTAWDAAGNSTTETITYTVDDTDPVVLITLPAENGFYKTSTLPDNPTFTVDEKNPYTTDVLGYNRETETNSTVTIKATDAAGNVGTATINYTVDNTAPTITSTLIDGGYYNADALDELGTYYDVKDTNLVPESVQASEIDTTEGEHTAVITAVDKAGNKAEKTIHYIVDNTVPKISFYFTDEGFYTSANFKNYDPYYQVEDTNLDNETIKASEIGFTEKLHEVTVSASDKAKNFNSASASYTIDDTKPEVTISLKKGKYYNLAALAELGIYYSATDTNLADVEASPLGTVDGTYTAEVKARDKAGNETQKSVQYYVDNTAPKIEFDETKLADGGFYNAAYLKALTGAFYQVIDNNPETDSASDLIFEEGTHKFTVTATDKAGNTTSKTISYTVDNTDPTITFNLTPEGYYQTAKLPGTYYNATDNNDGLEVTADPFLTTEGTYTLNVTATDKAGNSTSKSITYTVDNTNPVIEFHLTPGKHYTTKALTEALSGFDKYYLITEKHLNEVQADELMTEEGEHTLTVTAMDEAGNAASGSIIYTVDNTAPMISGLEGLIEGQRFLVGQAVDVIPIVEDNLDKNPNLQFSERLDTSKAGVQSITVTATDKAGNKSTFKYSFHVYNFSGVLQPVKADGSSTFKKNSTVPVKFQIADGAQYVKDAKSTISLVKISNEGSEEVAQVISTSSATEGNLFRYDSTDNQYIFNLGTKTLDDGKYKACITIDLDGGKIIKESQTFSIRK
ncbi:Ig-like domain-containing protein [Neobacillus sp. 19]|uniref:Ig-like domain-containing protein n=1 Tax=Neobacillus sp. 19 TaxID=3394458 RepID=UPI003BF70D36